MKRKRKPKYLYKIMTSADWARSKEQGYLVLSAIDQAFIHLSMEDQVMHALQKFFPGKDIAILKLDPEKCLGNLVKEANKKGTNAYYHLYNGNIPLDAVILELGKLKIRSK